MRVICPSCREQIPADRLDGASEWVECPHCETETLRTLLRAEQPTPADLALANPPFGCWFHENAEGWRIGAMTLSPLALAVVPLAVIWIHFVGGRGLASVIQRGVFDLKAVLFCCISIGGSTMMACALAVVVAGKCEIVVRRDEARVFTGVGPIGKTRRFDWANVRRISECWIRRRRGIVLRGTSTVRFETGAPLRRHVFLIEGLRELHRHTSEVPN